LLRVSSTCVWTRVIDQAGSRRYPHGSALSGTHLRRDLLDDHKPFERDSPDESTDGEVGSAMSSAPVSMLHMGNYGDLREQGANCRELTDYDEGSMDMSVPVVEGRRRERA
jgi:hypothetical protein